MQKIIKFFILVIVFISTSSTTYAARLYFDIPDDTNITKDFEVDVKLDTEGTYVNSVDLDIVYPQNLVNFSGYKNEDGIINIWLKQPQIDKGHISLSGIIPGGVEGYYDPIKSSIEPLIIAKLLFSPQNIGSGEFVFINSNILLNDGNGTKLSYIYENKQIKINSIDNSGVTNISKDNDLPEPFNIIFVKSNYFSETPSMLIFSTTDKTSGIKDYEIYKNKNEWSRVASPISIKRFLFSHEVKIRAVDYNNNYRESSVVIPGILSPFILLLIIGAVVLVFCVILWYNIKRK